MPSRRANATALALLSPALSRSLYLPILAMDSTVAFQPIILIQGPVNRRQLAGESLQPPHMDRAAHVGSSDHATHQFVGKLIGSDVCADMGLRGGRTPSAISCRMRGVQLSEKCASRYSRANFQAPTM